MRIPNAENAVVAIEKLTAYSLDPRNEIGRHKAKVFASALGLRIENANVLRKALLNAVLTREAVSGKSDIYGDRYIVDFDLMFGGRCARTRSVWIIDAGRLIPRLVTCYII